MQAAGARRKTAWHCDGWAKTQAMYKTTSPADPSASEAASRRNRPLPRAKSNSGCQAMDCKGEGIHPCFAAMFARSSSRC
eukprot:4332940-Pyramimonas_sp.AAC.1